MSSEAQEEGGQVGRPPLYATPSEFKAKADAYFGVCDTDGKRASVNGLCLALDMTRETLLRYEEKPEFSDTVKKVRMRLEMYWEESLSEPNAAGTIFWLKNQGWTDKTQSEISGPDGGPIPTTITVIGVAP